MPYTGSVPVSKITIGGATNVGSTTIYECISEIDVYEVFMMAPYTNGTTIKTVGHLYATCEGASGTKPGCLKCMQSVCMGFLRRRHRHSWRCRNLRRPVT